VRRPRHRAAFLRQFAVLLGAGVPPAAAVRSLTAESPPRDRAGLAVAADALADGHSIAAAFHASGLVDGRDERLLAAFEQIGRTDRALAAIASRIEHADRHAGLAGARSLLPVGLLVVAAAIGPMPAWLQGDIDGWTWLRAFTAPLALVLAIGIAAYAIWRTGRTRLLETGQALQVIATALESGLPPHLSLRLAAEHAAHRGAAARLRDASGLAAAGRALYDCLVHARLVPRADDRARARLVAASGDAAILSALADRRRRRSDEQVETASLWTPRLLYAVTTLLLFL
jgi:type II secretory pathway component PulF